MMNLKEKNNLLMKKYGNFSNTLCKKSKKNIICWTKQFFFTCKLFF